MKKLVSIQYPSGGFGHTIHVILSKFGKNFAVNPVEYEFGIGGDSHLFPLLLPKMYAISEYNIELFQQALSTIGNNQNVTILIDSGINDDSTDFKKIIFPSHAIRICYNDWTWPLIAKMFYTRCMSAVDSKKYNVSDFVKPDLDNWNSESNEDWALREKYFLYLRDHHFRYMWRPDDKCLTLPIEKILNYQDLKTTLNQWFEVKEFKEFYESWLHSNNTHFNFYFDCLDIVNCINTNCSKDLSDVTDIFTQAVVYYYIWLEYNFEVPHNDYSNWFTNTSDIVKMLREHGVDIDQI